MSEEAVQVTEQVQEQPVEQVQEQAPQAQSKWASFDDNDKIAFMRESLGDLPKGTEIKIINGRPVVVGKANGKEFVKNFDQLVRDYQFTEAADQKFNAGKEYEKKAKEQAEFNQSLVKQLIENPQYYYTVLKQAGYSDNDINEVAAKQLEQAIQEAETPQEIRDLRKFQKENEDLKKRLEEIENKEKASIEAKKLEEHYNTKKTELFKALEDNGLFDKDVPEEVRYNFAKVALYWMKQAEDQGIEGYTAQKAVAKVAKDMAASNKYFMSRLKPEERINHLPEDMAKIFAASLPKTKAVTPTANSLGQMKQEGKPVVQKEPQKKARSLNDYFNKL